MILFLRTLVKTVKDWGILIYWLLVMYIISMLGMFSFELDTFWITNILRTIWNFTWWFIITISTVGYGDISPKTPPGQFIAICDIVFGVGLMTAAIGKGVNGFMAKREKDMKGENTYEQLKRHIVILGGGKLEKLKTTINEIRNDGKNKNTNIVIVSDFYETCPLDNVKFVKGKIKSNDSLKRAGVSGADSVIIYGYTDEETILTTVKVNRKCSGKIVVYIRDQENYTYIEQLNESRDNQKPMISIIGRCTDKLLAQEIADHGVVDIFNQLIENGNHTFYTSHYKGSSIQADLAAKMVKRDCNGLLISVRKRKTGRAIVNPDPTITIVDNDTLYIISKKRPEINWSNREV